MWTERTALLIGEENCEKLKNASITVVGVGGVGGATAIMLARCGVGELRLIDFDRVEESNINRQVVANTETIGKLKVEILKEMILKINPIAKVEAISEKLTKENVSALINKDSYVVDAIDSVADKVELCDFCYKNNIAIISAMGAGNRFDTPNFKLTDIYKTSNDGLAKVMRKKLKERGVKKLDVVVAESVAEKITPVGSIAYYPIMCGCVICSTIVNNIISYNINFNIKIDK